MFRNKYSHNKFLAILLITSILFSVFSSVLPVYAVEVEAEASAELGAADTGLTVEPLVLSADDVPEVIDFAEAQEKGHVLRLRSKECDDNTVVFLNDDNTETMYVFAEPVKYTDEYGNIKDKSTALTLSDGAYTMAQNDVEVTFESDIANGVSISRGDVNITMTPVPTTVNSGSLSTTETVTLGTLSNNRMSYANVFDTAELVYTPLYSGFKEDIVLESYNGVSEFSFIVNTNGLTPVKQENGAVWFYDLTTDELAAKMMQVVCYDSAFNFAEGDVRITEIKANQIYGFTVVADAAFLADEDTVYPVYVDPTITLDDATAIEDTVVYSGKPTRNYGDYNYLNVGYVDSSYGRGTMMVRFPTLANNSTFASLTGDDIDSATLSMFTASGGSGTELLYMFIGSIDWTESTATYNSIANIPAPTQFNQQYVPSGGGVPMQFDLTNVVEIWADGTSYATPNKGIFVLNSGGSDPDKCRDFLSVEYAMSSSSREVYMPKLVIKYGTELSNSAISIVEGGSYPLTINDDSGCTVSWSSSNTTVATVNSSGTINAIKAGTANITATLTNSSGTSRSLTCVVYVYKPNGVYYITNAYSGYRLTVENGRINNLSNVHTNVNKNYSTSTPVDGLSQMWKFEYIGAGKYRIHPFHFMKSSLYVSGTNVTIYNTTSSSASWTIEYGSSGYYIRNNGLNNKTLQLESNSTAAPMEVVASATTTASRARWNITKISSPPSGLLLYDTESQTAISANESLHPTEYVAPNETRSLTNLKLATSIYASNMSAQSLSWSVVEGTGVVTVDSSGNIKGVSPGTALIKGYRYVNNISKQVYIAVIVTPIPNKTYLIKSRESNKYVDIKDQTMSNGTILHQWDLHTGDSQKWEFTHVSDGYYKIRSRNSTSSYYLGVESDSSNAGATMVLRSGTVTDGMLWKIEATSDGAYRIRSKICQSSEVSLALETKSDNNGIKIQQYGYCNDDDFCDEWYILVGVHLGMSTDNYTFEGDNKRGSYGYADAFYNNLSDSNNLQIFKTHHYNKLFTNTASKNDFSVNGAISNDIDFMVYIGHGGVADNANGNFMRYSYGTDGSSYPDNTDYSVYRAYTSEMNFGANDSNLRWVWLYTCNFMTTGEYVTEDSLKEMMTGAHIVMGNASRTTLCDAMAVTFAEYLESGMPIIEAYLRAGHDGEASVAPEDHFQKVLYIPEVEGENIYSPLIHYQYDADDVLIITKNIQDPFN